MKKFVVLLGLLFLFMESPKAYMLSVEQNGEDYVYKYGTTKIYNRVSFLLRMDMNIDYSFDRQLINNLAAYGRSTDVYDQVVVQKLIYENVNKDYTVKVLDDFRNPIDTSKKEQEIFSTLEEYKKPHPLDGSTYEANFGDELKVKNVNSGAYFVQEYSYSNYGSEYVFSMSKKNGQQKLTFKNIIDRDKNYVLSDNYAYNEFSVYVNVHGRTINFDIEPNSSFIFSVYNKYRYLYDITVDSNNLTHYFKEEDLRLVDVSAGFYEKNDDIFITKDETISLRPNLRTVNVHINTYMTDYPKKNELIKTYNDFTIYDKNNNIVASCKEENCGIQLKIGEYFIKDNVSNLTHFKFFAEDTTDYIYRFIIGGIISDKEIVKTKHDDEEVGFSKDQSINWFDEVNDYKYLDIYFIDEVKRIYLSDYENYLAITDLGFFYKIPENEPIKDDDKTITKDEEQKSDITKDNQTKTNENAINSEENNENTTEGNTISIPNTGLEKEELVYKKEEYEKDFNNNSNNNPM